MGKDKKSKKRRHSSSSESSSRRSYSRRSQSSQSNKHKQKKHKHKHDQRRKDDSKKNKKHHKEQKRKQQKQRKERERQRQEQRERQRYEQRERQRYEQRESRNERLPKRERHNEDLPLSMKSQNLKQQQFEVKKLQQEIQQYPISGRPQRPNYQLQSQNQIQQQQKPQKQQPCFEPSGILLEYYNARQGVSLRFHQPPEAREPEEQWRMYVFKGEQVLKPIMLTKSSYLIGKDDRVVDILTQNPSISRQHCVIQFRLIQKRQTEGEYIQLIKPYVMDLQSTNGTFLNDQKIESGRYYQLLHRDVLKFGFSDREYVIVKWEGQDQQEGN